MPKDHGGSTIGREERYFKSQTENSVQKPMILKWNSFFKHHLPNQSEIKFQAKGLFSTIMRT